MSAAVQHPPGYAEENKGPLILAVTTSITAVTLLFVVARLYSRHISLGLAIDDFVLSFSMTLSIIYVGLAGAAISYGGGKHADVLDPADVSKAVYYIVISFVPGVSAFVIPKFAVVMLLTSLLNPRRWLLRCMWVASAIYGVLGIIMLVINFVQCNPPAAQWGGAEGICWDREITVDYSLMLGIVSAVFDLFLAIYPTVVLWKLQLNWKKKLALSSSLGFGYCATIVTIYKCTTLPGLLHIKDFTYAVDDVIVWTNIEANFVIIGACIPTMFPLIKKLFGNKALSGTTSQGKSTGRSGPSNAIVTIGSYAKRGKRTKSGTEFEIDDLGREDGKYVILEERSFHYSTTELRADENSNSAPDLERQNPARPAGW